MIWKPPILRRRSERRRHVDQQRHHRQCVVERFGEFKLVKLLGTHHLASAS